MSSRSSMYSHVMSSIIVVTLMHHWYDGFIWSVKKGDVKLQSSA